METEQKEKYSAADILKIVVILLASAFLVYRSFIPFLAEFRFREAYNAQAQKKIDVSIDKFSQAVKLAPWETHYHVQLGKLYEDKASAAAERAEKIAYIKKAEDIYLECLRISPQNPWYHNRLGEVYKLYATVAETPDESQEWLKKRDEKINYAAGLDPNNALFQMALAYLYHQQEDFDNALKKYQHVLTIDDRFAEAYFNMADIYRRRGDVEQQIAMYKMIFEKKPTFPNAHLQLGRIYEMQGNLDAAILEYMEEAKIDKNNVTAFEILGRALYLKKDWRNLEVVYRRLILLQPNNPKNYILLAQAQAQTGQLKQALESLNSAQLLMPGNKEIAANIRRLENIINPPKPAPVKAPEPLAETASVSEAAAAN